MEKMNPEGREELKQRDEASVERGAAASCCQLRMKKGAAGEPGVHQAE